MKKYVSCFLFFLTDIRELDHIVSPTVGEEAQRAEEVQMQESVENGICEGDKEIHVVLNMSRLKSDRGGG
ncbi:MAG: hypothetical protein ACLTFJ_13610 [Clostridium sp.]